MDYEDIARTIKCFKCGAEAPEGSKFCNSCGAALSVSCPYCGKKLSGDSKFCNYCGKELGVGGIFCNYCGEELGSDSRFCNYCGKELASAPKPPAKPPAEDFVYVDAAGTLLKGFFICTHQVTQEEYQRIMGGNPSSFSGGKNPVENVSWYGCIEYCNKRSLAEGLKPYYYIAGGSITCNEGADGYRLLTEAEWEYAARGGNRSRGYEYSGSDDIGEVAWYAGNFDGHTHPVCMKKPNELGIYDMSGNVSEWCWDWFDASCSRRVIRGGGWECDADSCSVSHRFYGPLETSINPGFRLARSAQD